MRGRDGREVEGLLPIFPTLFWEDGIKKMEWGRSEYSNLGLDKEEEDKKRGREAGRESRDE